MGTVDVMNVDCNGCEWSTYKSWLTQDVSVRQVVVAVHKLSPANPEGGGRLKGTHAFFDFFTELGYVIFHKEADLLAKGHRIQYSLLKLSPAFQRKGRFCCMRNRRSIAPTIDMSSWRLHSARSK